MCNLATISSRSENVCKISMKASLVESFQSEINIPMSLLLKPQRQLYSLKTCGLMTQDSMKMLSPISSKLGIGSNIKGIEQSQLTSIIFLGFLMISVGIKDRISNATSELNWQFSQLMRDPHWSIGYMGTLVSVIAVNVGTWRQRNPSRTRTIPLNYASMISRGNFNLIFTGEHKCTLPKNRFTYSKRRIDKLKKMTIYIFIVNNKET